MTSFHQFRSKQFFRFILLSGALLHVLFFATQWQCFSFSDARWRWQECAYVLHGINPFDVIMRVCPPMADIGDLPSIAGNVPWEFCWGNLFLPAILPFSHSLAIMLAEQVVATIALALLVARLIKNQGICTTPLPALLTALCLLLVQPGYFSSLQLGNQGALICLILASVFFISDRHPFVSGILLGLAMCKPQTALLFFLPLLLRWQWKTILTAGGVTLLGWTASVIATGTEPFEMLRQMGEVSNQYGNYGLLTGVEKIWHTQPSVLRLSNALLSLIIFAALLIRLYKKGMQNDMLLIWSLLSVISVVWFYKQPHDYVILLFPMLYLLEKEHFSLIQLLLIILLLLFPELYHVSRCAEDAILSLISPHNFSFHFSGIFWVIRPYASLLLVPMLLRTAEKKHCLHFPAR